MFLVAFFYTVKSHDFHFLDKNGTRRRTLWRRTLRTPHEAFMLINPNLTLCRFLIIGYSIHFIFEAQKDKKSQFSLQKTLVFLPFSLFLSSVTLKNFKNAFLEAFLEAFEAYVESEFIRKSPQIMLHKMDFFVKKRLVRTRTLRTFQTEWHLLCTKNV